MEVGFMFFFIAPRSCQNGSLLKWSWKYSSKGSFKSRTYAVRWQAGEKNLHSSVALMAFTDFNRMKTIMITPADTSVKDML
jgi:hypothetical protein